MAQNSTPLVSVVVPVYNVEQYLNRCIDSILTQTVKSLELILVDDGSADQSGAICDSYAEMDQRIIAIHQENQGVSKARNAGIDHARGEYLFFVDSDDWIEPNHIENLLPIADEDCVYGGHKFYVNGILTEERPAPSVVVTKDEWINDYEYFARRGLILFFVSPCYRMSIINQHHLRFEADLQVCEDGLFNLAYMKYCNKIRYTSKCTYCYEDGDDTSTSLSHRFQPMRLYADMQKCQKTEEITKKKELRIRWQHWNGVIRHYRKWLCFNGGINKEESYVRLKECYRSKYFRECIPYIRKNGSLDEKIQTYFMRPWLHVFYKPFYSCIVLVSRLKKKLLS